MATGPFKANDPTSPLPKNLDAIAEAATPSVVLQLWLALRHHLLVTAAVPLQQHVAKEQMGHHHPGLLIFPLAAVVKEFAKAGQRVDGEGIQQYCAPFTVVVV